MSLLDWFLFLVSCYAKLYIVVPSLLIVLFGGPEVVSLPLFPAFLPPDPAVLVLSGLRYHGFVPAGGPEPRPLQLFHGSPVHEDTFVVVVLKATTIAAASRPVEAFGDGGDDLTCPGFP